MSRCAKSYRNITPPHLSLLLPHIAQVLSCGKLTFEKLPLIKKFSTAENFGLLDRCNPGVIFERQGDVRVFGRTDIFTEHRPLYPRGTCGISCTIPQWLLISSYLAKRQ